MLTRATETWLRERPMPCLSRKHNLWMQTEHNPHSLRLFHSKMSTVPGLGNPALLVRKAKCKVWRGDTTRVGIGQHQCVVSLRGWVMARTSSCRGGQVAHRVTVSVLLAGACAGPCAPCAKGFLCITSQTHLRHQWSSPCLQWGHWNLKLENNFSRRKRPLP